MKYKFSLRTYLPLFVIVFIAPFLWAESNENSAVETPEPIGVYIVTHDEIVRSGARDLSDVLARVPGIRITFNSSQSRPSAGALVSSDSPTRLAASHFSRILMLFNGHQVNKYWHGGADFEWSTGFLEGLKEIRVYTCPATAAVKGGTGAMDMVIDLIPFEGNDQKGSVDVRLTQSFNQHRLDKSLLHVGTGNLWGQDGHYSVFADVTQWGGVDVLEPCETAEPGSRMDRKNPTFQFGVLFKKGAYDVMARHLEHDHFDPYNCGRKWGYTFIEARRSFEFPAKWDFQVTAGADHIVSKWGAASSAQGEAVGDWDKVTEFRLMLRAQLKRDFKKTSIYFGVDYLNFKIDGGPERSDDYFSVMNFSTRRSRAGADLRLVRRLAGPWWFKGAVRVEKAQGYGDTAVLPEVSLLYKKGTTRFGLGYATGHRYMDTWYRVGSNYYNPGNAVPTAPYIVPVELKPELNRQFKLFIARGFGRSWEFQVDGFMGKYSHLMGLDWDYTLEYLFNQLRAMEVGNYSYWGGAGSLFYRGERLRIGANVSFQGVFDAQLSARQLYVSVDGDHPLFLPPVTANFFLDWDITRRVLLSARFFTAGGARNGGTDLASPAFETVFDVEPFQDTPSYTNMDVSLRFVNIWKKIEIQISAHNVFDDHVRLPMIEGGTFLSRGREITLTLRRQF